MSSCSSHEKMLSVFTVSLTNLGFYYINQCGNFLTNTFSKLKTTVLILMEDSVKANDLSRTEEEIILEDLK